MRRSGLPSWSALSLRWRLGLVTAVALSIALLASGWVLGGLFRSYAEGQFEAQLLRHLEQLTASLELDAQGRPQLATPLTDPRWRTPYSGLYWQVEALGRDADPRTSDAVLRSRSLWDGLLRVPLDRLEAGELHWHDVAGPDGQPVRAVERIVQLQALAEAAGEAEPPLTPWRLVVAEQTQELERAVEGFHRQLIAHLAVLAFALGLAAWIQVRLGLAPLRLLLQRLQAVRTGESPRLGGPFPAEVAPLADEFNRVLDQQEHGVNRARHLAGNLAHGIKTPLAVLGQLAERCGDAAMARQMSDQLRAIRTQVDWHLSRARMAGSGGVGLRTPVRPLIAGLVRVMEKLHADRADETALSITLEVTPENLTFSGEPQDLQEMVGNLLDNACKWASSLVCVSARREGDGLLITVADDGPGLPPDLHAAVLERGVRADERKPGSGLGLAIVRELAELYGGRLALQRSAWGGLSAVLTLPGGPRVAPVSPSEDA